MNSSTLKVVVLGVLTILVLSVTHCTRQEKKAELPAGAKESKPFSLPDMGGKTVSLADYKGKVVFLNFWATWCGPCRQEIPDLVELYKDYKDKGFEILAVSVDAEGAQIVKPFADRFKINYKVLVNGDKVAEDYTVEAIPTTVVIDRQGNVRETLIGARSRSTLEATLKPLL